MLTSLRAFRLKLCQFQRVLSSFMQMTPTFHSAPHTVCHSDSSVRLGSSYLLLAPQVASLYHCGVLIHEFSWRFYLEVHTNAHKYEILVYMLDSISCLLLWRNQDKDDIWRKHGSQAHQIYSQFKILVSIIREAEHWVPRPLFWPGC